MQEKNIKTLSFGCRLNALETEKIQMMLSPVLSCAIVINTCAVTAEAERQSAQAVRKLARENENAPIFVTGCAATRNPGLFSEIPNTIVIDNKEKMNLDAYSAAFAKSPCYKTAPEIKKFHKSEPKLSKKFIQIQNGCNHSCTYCVTRLLRGKSESFSYETILNEAQTSVSDGFFEIVLTGVDIASYFDNQIFLSDLCEKLLNDVPEIKRLRLSSMDPASPEITKIIELMKTDSRLLPHIHLSMQSGSNSILTAMRRRHTAEIVKKIMQNKFISFSWDIICGFPGETPELFEETADLARELLPIKIHAFPFSARPDTVAATLAEQIDRNISKKRVKIISEIADENKLEFMKSKIGTVSQVLVEENNTARTPDDIEIKIKGDKILAKTVCDLKITNISDLHFVGEIC
ncbi:MAG: MiaB/RimO family radical SAM methylthiotransferase [Alphaproteobacteria bacterium]|nr:MiaB/RimO family radical SAM methylthiotransferase [Alphaproteobacteria bacterium]MBN2674859.1 MiaB/RimO family radical SAM methylthiotransferase [Alphaproteobacteria bacterium]